MYVKQQKNTMHSIQYKRRGSIYRGVRASVRKRLKYSEMPEKMCFLMHSKSENGSF